MYSKLDSVYSELGSHLEALCWIFHLEVSHELCQVKDSFNWHGIVHTESDSGVGRMGNNLCDAYFLCLTNKSLLQLLVSSCNSKDDICSTPVCKVSDL